MTRRGKWAGKSAAGLGAAALLGLSGSAQAQIVSLDQGAHFSLKPRMRLSMLPSGPALPRQLARVNAIGPAPASADPLELQIDLLRRTYLFVPPVATGTGDPLTGRGRQHAIAPRTRLRYVSVAAHVPVGDRGVATLGWQGGKLSNRNANVTAAFSADHLRTRDWFLPRAEFAIAARPGLILTTDYAESLRAYGGTGIAGPMGLTREDFRAMQGTLRPERQSRMRLTADWAASNSIAFSLSALAGRIRDRLSFVADGYLPVNGGSAQVRGGMIATTHRLSPALTWSLRYSHVRFDLADGGKARENRLALEGIWTDGPWRATLSAARAGAPALVPGITPAHRPLRIGAGIEYRFQHANGLRLAARLTDPDRLAGTGFMQDNRLGAAIASDQARAAMLSATMLW